jgi:hypothetical protein
MSDEPQSHAPKPPLRNTGPAKKKLARNQKLFASILEQPLNLSS